MKAVEYMNKGHELNIYIDDPEKKARLYRRTLLVVVISQIFGGAGLTAIIESPLLLFISFFIYGAGTATNLQARYAGTDLAEKHQRATSVSIAMVGMTLGAVAGPNLVGVRGRL